MIYQLGILICNWVLSEQVYFNTDINAIFVKHFRTPLVWKKGRKYVITRIQIIVFTYFIFRRKHVFATNIFQIYHFMFIALCQIWASSFLVWSSNFFLNLPSFRGKEGKLRGRLNHLFIKSTNPTLKISPLTFVNFSFWFF